MKEVSLDTDMSTTECYGVSNPLKLNSPQRPQKLNKCPVSHGTEIYFNFTDLIMICPATKDVA